MSNSDVEIAASRWIETFRGAVRALRYGSWSRRFAVSGVLLLIAGGTIGKVPDWLSLSADWAPAFHYAFVGLSMMGVLALASTAVLVWRSVIAPAPPPSGVKPVAIKGVAAFGPDEGELFWRLGRRRELQQILSWVRDVQVPLILVQGESGAGKTSLLRAGLSRVLRDGSLSAVYWEAVPNDPMSGLLSAIQTTWHTPEDAPQTIEDFLRCGDGMARVVVIDQAEQLNPDRHTAIFAALASAVESNPPYQTTWIVAFRDEYASRWLDFQASKLSSEGRRRIELLSLRLFKKDEAHDVVSVLVEESGLKNVNEQTIRELIASIADGDHVSPVDIGIGLLVLSETDAGDLRSLGGHAGLVASYLESRVNRFPPDLRDPVLRSLLYLVDQETDQRIAEGRPLSELIEGVGSVRPDAFRACIESLEKDRILVLLPDKPKGDLGSRYRLGHERLILGLRRLLGMRIAGAEEASLILQRRYARWQGEKNRGDLLSGSELRKVLRHQRELAFRGDVSGKMDFIRRSQRARANNILKTATAVGGGAVVVLSMFYIALPAEPPAIDYFYPRGGKPGTIVTITGARLDRSAVSLGDVLAPVIDAEPHRVIVRVPDDATSGKFRLRRHTLLWTAEALSTGSFAIDVGRPIHNEARSAVKVGVDPQQVAFTPDGRWAFVTNAGSNDVSVIDFSVDREVDVDGAPENGMTRIDAGQEPYGIAIGPKGDRLYVSNRRSNNISVIDVVGRRLIKQIDLGEDPSSPHFRVPESLALSPDGSVLYVASRYHGYLSVIDLATETLDHISLKERAGLMVGEDPVAWSSHLKTDIALTPDGEKAYVTVFREPFVMVVDLRRRETVKRIDLALRKTFPAQTNHQRSVPSSDRRLPRALTIVEDKLLVAANAHTEGPFRKEVGASLAVIDTSTDEIDEIVTLDSDVVPKDVAGRGRQIFMTLGSEVWFLDTQQYATRARVPLIADAENVTPVPKRDRAYVVAGDALKLIDTKHRRLIMTPTGVARSHRDIVLSLDGERAFVCDDMEDVVHVVNMNSLRPFRAIAVGNGPSSITLHPNGYLAYLANREDGTVSVVDFRPEQGREIDIDSDNANGITRISVGGHPKQVTTSPDGRLVFVLLDSGIVVIDTATQQVLGTPITLPHDLRTMALHPTGATAYVITSSEQPKLLVVDLQIRQIVASKDLCDRPKALAIKPDGEKGYLQCSDKLLEWDIRADSIIFREKAPLTGWGGAGAIGITPDQKMIYVAEETGGGTGGARAHVVVVEIDTDAIVDKIYLGQLGAGGELQDLIFSPDGTEAYVLDKVRGITVID